MIVDEQARLELERRLHGLICGEPDDRRRRRVLGELADDQAARALLAEMLAVQDAARAAFGYDRAESEHTNGAAPLSAGAARPPGSALIFSRPPRSAVRTWALRAAAAIIVGISVTLAITARLGRGHGDPTSPPDTAQAALPGIDRGELDGYRRLWGQVSDSSSAEAPWVLLTDGKGQFGYLPGAPGSGPGGMVLLRCLVLAPDGQTLERLNVLLPGRGPVRLDLPDAGVLAGEPMHCEVTTGEGPPNRGESRFGASEKWASVAVTVGESSRGPAGVSGRVGLGGAPVEIGQFTLHGRKMRVVVHVVSLDTALG